MIRVFRVIALGLVVGVLVHMLFMITDVHLTEGMPDHGSGESAIHQPSLQNALSEALAPNTIPCFTGIESLIGDPRTRPAQLELVERIAFDSIRQVSVSHPAGLTPSASPEVRRALLQVYRI